MAISSTNLTILGTAAPWKLGSGASNPGPLNVLEPYNTGFWDGTAAASGGVGQNSAYPYGKQHTTAGETAPTVLSGLTAGQIVLLQYTAGTVQTGGGGGAGNSPPSGSPTTGVLPLPAGGCDTENMPSNVVPGYLAAQNGNGTINTVGTAVTWVSGTKFTGALNGAPIWINSVLFFVSAVTSTTTLTLTATAGTQTGVSYFTWGAQASIGALVGAFTDGSGNIVLPIDWTSQPTGTLGTINAFALTSVAAGTGVYQGTITGGGTNVFVGCIFTVTGFTNAKNNGTFICTANTTTTITLLNLNSQIETHAGTATQTVCISLRVPKNATALSLGINDTQLFDNTGSFSVTAYVLDSMGWAGDGGFFNNYPFGQCFPGAGADHAILKSAIAIKAPYVQQQTSKSVMLAPDYAGQLFPHGGQQAGGSPAGTAGQNFSF
jgi:hypothetical protein